MVIGGEGEREEGDRREERKKGKGERQKRPLQKSDGQRERWSVGRRSPALPRQERRDWE